MSGKLTIAQAETESAEERSWTCQSCNVMVEEEGPHCRSCAAYWSDVRNGLFSDDEWFGRSALSKAQGVESPNPTEVLP